MKSITAIGAVALGLSFSTVMAQSPATPPAPKFHQWALTPPMGWNSWDCYGAGVWEADVLANADYMDKNLKSHGWNIITADVSGSKDKYLALFNTAPAPVGGRGRRGGFGGMGGPGGPVGGPASPNSVPAPAPAAAPAPVDPNALLPVKISVPLADIGLTGPCKVRDLWTHKDLGTMDTTISATVKSHGTVLYRVSPVQ